MSRSIVWAVALTLVACKGKAQPAHDSTGGAAAAGSAAAGSPAGAGSAAATAASAAATAGSAAATAAGDGSAAAGAGSAAPTAGSTAAGDGSAATGAATATAAPAATPGTPAPLLITEAGALGFRLDYAVADHPEFLDDHAAQPVELRARPVLKKVGENKVEVWVAMERQLVLSLENAKTIIEIQVVGKMPRTAEGLGVGTEAKVLTAKLGAVANLDTSTRGQACADFKKLSGLRFCFASKAKAWPALEAAHALVASVKLTAEGEGEGEE
jgi:hypothetical protein